MKLRLFGCCLTSLTMGLACTAKKTDQLPATVDAGGTKTGEFQGKLSPEGALSATWKNPSGDKQLPFRFAESNAPGISAATSATPPTPVAGESGKAIEVANADQITDFLVKLAASNGTTVARADAVKDYEKFSTPSLTGSSSFETEFTKKYHLPTFNSNRVSLYIADLNNDGATDYALTDIHTVGSHNNRLVAVYTDKGDKVTEVRIPKGAPFLGAYHFAQPFLSVDAEGTTMRFLELSGGPTTLDLKISATARYLWKGNVIKLLEKKRAP